MGNICSSLNRNKKVDIISICPTIRQSLTLPLQVSTPTSLEELVETQVSSETGTVEEDASRSPWVESFLQSPGMRDRDRREMLYFRLLTSRLFRTSTDQLEKTRSCG